MQENTTPPHQYPTPTTPQQSHRLQTHTDNLLNQIHNICLIIRWVRVVHDTAPLIRPHTILIHHPLQRRAVPQPIRKRLRRNPRQRQVSANERGDFGVSAPRRRVSHPSQNVCEHYRRFVHGTRTPRRFSHLSSRDHCYLPSAKCEHA